MGAAKVRKGFTLIEMLIAVAVLAVGLTSALYLFSAAMRNQAEAILAQRAADLAEAVIAQLSANLTSSADLKKLAKKKASHPDFPNMRYSVHILPLDNEEQELLVAVDVEWVWRGRAIRRRFSTVLLRRLEHPLLRVKEESP